MNLDRLTRNGWEVLGSTAAHLSDMADLVELVRFGALDLSGVSVRTFPLEKANEALQTVLDRPGSEIFCVGIRLDGN
jgi:threonine dehydrogenase-like Zn-dependent dehydrogenase